MFQYSLHLVYFLACLVYLNREDLKFLQTAYLKDFHVPRNPHSKEFRACLHGGGEPQVSEVTCLGEVKK